MKDEVTKAFELEFDVPDFLFFDGEDFMYYGEDPLLDEQCQSIQDQYRGYKSGARDLNSSIEIINKQIKELNKLRGA